MRQSSSARSRAIRAGILGYAAVAYASFLVSALWAIGFLANVGAPQTVDRPGHPRTWLALLVDAGLLALFAVQHTVMARQGFKRWLTQRLPAAAERSTYVLSAGLLLILLFWQWQPVPTEVWRLSSQPLDGLAWALYAVGWLVAISSTFMIDHLDFLGLRQAFAHGRSYRTPRFAERWLYAWVRHPMMLGLVIAFWATPSMTVGHLFFAAGGTGYILVGLHFEERELVRDLGDAYADYARRVPRVVPGVRGSNARSSRKERTSLAD